MKIKSIERRDNKLFIKTDDKLRPSFVYPEDKFSSYNELEAEMERSLAASMKHEEAKVRKALQLDEEIKEAMDKAGKELKDDKQ